MAARIELERRAQPADEASVIGAAIRLDVQHREPRRGFGLGEGREAQRVRARRRGELGAARRHRCRAAPARRPAPRSVAASMPSTQRGTAASGRTSRVKRFSGGSRRDPQPRAAPRRASSAAERGGVGACRAAARKAATRCASRPRAGAARSATASTAYSRDAAREGGLRERPGGDGLDRADRAREQIQPGARGDRRHELPERHGEEQCRCRHQRDLAGERQSPKARLPPGGAQTSSGSAKASASAAPQATKPARRPR